MQIALPSALPGSQCDAGASVVLRVLWGWRWNRTDFCSSVTCVVFPAFQPIRLSIFLYIMYGIFDQELRDFSVILMTLVTLMAPASYCKPGLALVSTMPQVVVASPYVYFNTCVLLVTALCTIHPVYCMRGLYAKVVVMCHSSHASLNRSILDQGSDWYSQVLCVCRSSS